MVTTQEVEDGKGVIARKRKKGDEVRDSGGLPAGSLLCQQEVYEFVEAEHGEHDGMDEESIRMHEETTKVKVSMRREQCFWATVTPEAVFAERQAHGDRTVSNRNLVLLSATERILEGRAD